MKALDHRTIEALASLQNNRDFDVVMDWIRSSQTEATIAAVHKDDDVSIRLAQGEARALGELILHADQARSYMKKNRKN